MKKKSKKYEEALNKIEKGKLYSLEDAVKLVKETSISKFDGTVEIAVRLNLDTKKNDQQLRGAIVLPHGTGKTKKVLVLAKGDAAKAATEAGADPQPHQLLLPEARRRPAWPGHLTAIQLERHHNRQDAGGWDLFGTHHQPAVYHTIL